MRQSHTLLTVALPTGNILCCHIELSYSDPPVIMGWFIFRLPLFWSFISSLYYSPALWDKNYSLLIWTMVFSQVTGDAMDAVCSPPAEAISVKGEGKQAHTARCQRDALPLLGNAHEGQKCCAAQGKPKYNIQSEKKCLVQPFGSLLRFMCIT